MRHDPGPSRSLAGRAAHHASFAIAAAAALLAMAGLHAGCANRGAEVRHVVLISVDTLRRDRLPCYGHPGDTAPFLTELAAQSVVFDNAIAAASVTAPSHASMFTGLGPPRHGILNNKCRLRDGVVTLAEILSANGFRTAAFVSGAPMAGQTSRLDRGFDLYDDDFGANRERPAAETARQVSRWLAAADPGQPTLLFVHFFDPHYPYSPPASYAEPFLPPGASPSPSPPYPELEQIRERGMTADETRLFTARYDGEIRYVDHELGTLVAELEARGFLERSLLIVLSDHGETLTDRSWFFDHGCRLYDEQIRVPLLVRLPHARGGGRRVAAPAHHVDVTPTVLAWLGIDAPSATEGVSLLGALDGDERSGQRAMFSMARCDLRRVPLGGGNGAGFGFIASLRAQQLKLVVYPVGKGLDFELFDLDQDRSETVNMALTRPDLRDQLWGQLEGWLGGRPDILRQPPETLLPELKPKLREALEELGYVEAGDGSDPRATAQGAPPGR